MGVGRHRVGSLFPAERLRDDLRISSAFGRSPCCFWPKAILTVAWGKRSAAPGGRNEELPLAESQPHLLGYERGVVKLAFSQSNRRSSLTWGGALLAPGYGDGLAFSQQNSFFL